ncbi:hypothetical protein PUN28_018817 [Cardiocondyla obscurior]|uniref:Uncharacterized protein n=1 Tax=Cardiocondyla obscurior TaxID=286306 RepID=A0AAW2EC78_9HYME
MKTESATISIYRVFRAIYIYSDNYVKKFANVARRFRKTLLLCKKKKHSTSQVSSSVHELVSLAKSIVLTIISNIVFDTVHCRFLKIDSTTLNVAPHLLLKISSVDTILFGNLHQTPVVYIFNSIFYGSAVSPMSKGRDNSIMFV